MDDSNIEEYVRRIASIAHLEGTKYGLKEAAQLLKEHAGARYSEDKDEEAAGLRKMAKILLYEYDKRIKEFHKQYDPEEEENWKELNSYIQKNYTENPQ